MAGRVKRPLGFVDGIGVGIGGIMLLPLLYWMVVHGSYVEMYKQFGSSAKLPGATIFAIGPAWSYGAPILLSLGFGLAIWQRPTRWSILAIGLVAVVASLFTYYAAYLPLWAISGAIRGG